MVLLNFKCTCFEKHLNAAPLPTSFLVVVSRYKPSVTELTQSNMAEGMRLIFYYVVHSLFYLYAFRTVG